MAISLWARACLALLKVVGGIAGFFLGQTPFTDTSPVPTIHLINLGVFGAAAALLIFVGPRDRRAQHLGTVFLLSASAFSDASLIQLGFSVPASVAPALTSLVNLQPYAFSPYFFWLFVRDFPRVSSLSWATQVLRSDIRLSLVAGTALFLANALLLFRSLLPDLVLTIFLAFDGTVSTSLYWGILYALILAAFPLALWKCRTAQGDERFRAQLFIAGFAIGTCPIVIAVLVVSLFSSLEVFLNSTSTLGVPIYAFLLSVPFTTAYSVLVNEVLEVKLIVRKALRYALARYTVIALTVLPFGLLVYQLRDRTIAQLFSGPLPLGLIAATGLGLTALAVREKVLKSIDRHFFREAYDSPRILSQFMQNWQSASNVEEYSAGFLETADNLNLESLAILTLDRARGEFRSAHDEVRPLPVGSSLSRFLQGSTDPVDIDLSDPDSPLPP